MDPDGDAARHFAVGALNPQRTSVALFSNIGDWVNLYAPGTSVLSVFPSFEGGLQAGSRNDRGQRRRQSLDPDDFDNGDEGGFAVWSGTSFAAPYVAGTVAAKLAPQLMGAAVGGRRKHPVDEAVEAITALDRSRLPSG